MLLYYIESTQSTYSTLCLLLPISTFGGKAITNVVLISGTWIELYHAWIHIHLHVHVVIEEDY